MNKHKLSPLLSALTCVVALTLAPAQAKKNGEASGQSLSGEVVCDDSRMASSSSSCIGPFEQREVDKVIDGFDFAYFGSSKSDHPFIDAPSGARAGTLTFDEALFGQFVLGIRAGNMYSFYLFDGDDEGIDSIDFDTTGVVERGNGQAGVMTEALLFTPGGVLPQSPARLPTGGPDGTEGPNEIPPPGPTVPSTAQQVPEPATGALALAALAAVGLTARRRKR